LLLVKSHNTKNYIYYVKKILLTAACCSAVTIAVAGKACTCRVILSRHTTKGTRSADGKPGSKYWQNFGRYNISITATPPGLAHKRYRTDHLYKQQPRYVKKAEHETDPEHSPPGLGQDGLPVPDYLNIGYTDRYFLISGQKKAWNNTQAATNQAGKLTKTFNAARFG
jgi:hypothetical protein